MKYSSIVTILLVFLTGCAVTGTANKATYPLLTNNANFISQLKSVNIIADENTADNESYGAFNWGSFDENDINLIQGSIFSAVNKNTPSLKPFINVNVKTHRYSQVITNASYASFVIIDWCIEENGQVKFDEVFYAGHSDDLNIFTGKSLGWAKGETHKAISSHIINKTIEYITNPNLKGAYPENHVFLNANDAVAALPKKLTSVGSAGFSGGAYYYVGSQTGNTDFDKKFIYDKVNWEKEIN